MKQIDLTIHLDQIDVAALLDWWRWLVPEGYQPIQMSKFGDWCFAAPDGQIIMLDLIEGELTPIAGSIDEYNKLKNHPDQQTDWFLDGFVLRCETEGLTLSDGECYGWRIHPRIGGKMEFENIQVFDLAVYQSLMGQLLPQWKQLKPGDPTPEIRITEEPNKEPEATR